MARHLRPSRRPRERRPPRRARLVFLAVLVLLAAAALSCGGADRSLRPDVIVILLDTVRADRLTPYGYGRPTTPRLEAFAREARTFRRAWSTSSWTAPAHASLFTGLYPSTHGATQENWTLDPGLDTLAEILGEHGYWTGAVVGNGMLSRERNFDQGFVHYEETFRADRRARRRGAGGEPTVDERSARAVEELLAAAPGYDPIFLFVNLIGPHAPYDSCGRFCDAFVSDPSLDLHSNHWLAYYAGVREFSEAELAHLSERYDGEIRKVDQVLGRLLDAVEARRGDRPRLVAVTSDHGEGFGEHGHVDHVFNLYEFATRIPLLVRYPERFEPGSRDERPVQLPDLFVTALRAAGVDPEPYAPQGVALEDAPARGRPLLLEYHRPVQALAGALEKAPPRLREPLRRWDHALRAVVLDERKLITRSDGRRELFALEGDPGETRDLSEDPGHAAALPELEATLDALERRYAEAAGEGTPHVPVSEETRRALEALGYVE